MRITEFMLDATLFILAVGLWNHGGPWHRAMALSFAVMEGVFLYKAHRR